MIKNESKPNGLKVSIREIISLSMQLRKTNGEGGLNPWKGKPCNHLMPSRRAASSPVQNKFEVII